MYITKDALGRAEIKDGEPHSKRRRKPRHGRRHKVVARKRVRTPSGSVMGFVLSSSQNVAQIAPPVAIKWNVTVYQQRRRRLGGSLYWDRVNDFSASTAEAATRKAEQYVKNQGWKTAADGGAAVSGPLDFLFGPKVPWEIVEAAGERAMKRGQFVTRPVWRPADKQRALAAVTRELQATNSKIDAARDAQRWLNEWMVRQGIAVERG